jgi:hypothetical protein
LKRIATSETGINNMNRLNKGISPGIIKKMNAEDRIIENVNSMLIPLSFK